MKVALAYPRANIDTVPSLVGAAEQLAEAGYDVDVYTYLQPSQPAATFASPRIRVRSLGVDGLADYSTAGLRGLVKRAGWLPGAARARLARGYQAFGTGLAHGTRLAARARGALADRPEPYVCVIGVDPDGLELAQSLAQGAPIAYYSLELLLSYELSTPSDIQVKARERGLSRQAAFIVVQDVERARLLAEDNAIPLERVVLVPNAPAGPARRRQSCYWHKRFDLPADARVVIHAGSLGAWTGVDRIIESAASWPSPWVLVIHTRYDAESSSYVDDLRGRAAPGRVWFSLKPVARNGYDALIDGADIGLAFYVSSNDSSFTQRNIQSIGLSSGKLAYYLRAGLPVVVNRDASIAEPIEASGCGVSVVDAASIGGALVRISAEYDAMSAGALAFFDQQLDFGSAFADVIRRVDALR